MLKIGQNWGKIANYPPNAQQRSAPLHLMQYYIHIKACILQLHIHISQAEESSARKKKVCGKQLNIKNVQSYSYIPNYPLSTVPEYLLQKLRKFLYAAVRFIFGLCGSALRVHVFVICVM